MRLLSFFCVFLLFSCNNNKTDTRDNGLTEVKLDGKTSNADIVRMPISADKPLDTVNVAKIVFDDPVYSFDEVAEGTIVKHTFTFKNTGKMPLIISDVRTTCGCTVPTWNKNPIPAGATDKIDVAFNTENKQNEQAKRVTVLGNTFPAETEVLLMGLVTPKK